MAEVNILGLGAWSPKFASWDDFATGMASGDWQADAELQPALLPRRERRRAPQQVKMAIEVMSQACRMAELEPHDVSTVCASVMGDMQITDYICTALAQTPKLLSPTRFHNSVHNAAPGYWSIATNSFSAASAVSAFDFTYSMAFLEGAIQAIEERTPVLVVTQEVAAPLMLADIWPSKHPMSTAFLLAPASLKNKAICRVQFSVEAGSCEWPRMPSALSDTFASDSTSHLVSLLVEIAAAQRGDDPNELAFPLSPFSSLKLTLNAPEYDRD